MPTVITIETTTTEDLDYQQELHERYISSLETQLDKYLSRELTGHGVCFIKLEYNPRDNKFRVLSLTPTKYQNRLDLVLKNNLKMYFE